MKKEKKTGKIIATIIIIVLAIAMIVAAILIIRSKLSDGDSNNGRTKISKEKEDDDKADDEDSDSVGDSDEDEDEDQDAVSSDDSDRELDFDNYQVNIEMVVDMAGIQTITYMDGVIDEAHQTEYYETSISSFGITIPSIITYTDMKAGKTYFKDAGTSGAWQVEKHASAMVDLGVFVEKINSSKDVEVIDTDKYRVKVSSSDVSGPSSGAGVEGADTSGDVYVDVTMSNGYITMLEYDLSELMEGMGTIKATIRISNYDTAGDVVIPDEVKNQAK